MTKNNKNINEELSELKNIPSGQEFSNMLSIYKAVNSDEAYGYKHGYDRKKTKGWNNQGADSYGEVGYTHLKLSTAISMCHGYGFDSIVQFKLLGGLKDYVFLDMDDPEIERLQTQTYGKRLNLEGQLLEITGNQEIARKYGGYTDPRTFGRTIHDRIWEEGYYIRGMVCDYWHDQGCIVVYPFKFSDMVTCAVATGIHSSMSVDDVRKRFTGVLGQAERDEQSKFVDIVPHLKVVGAFDPNGGQYIRVGDKIYAPYDSRKGPNILVIDDENIIKPKDYKLFPNKIRLDEMPTNISTKGRFYFIMKGISWEGNVMGIDDDGNQLTQDNSPIFKVKGSDQWFEWQYVEWMYENPQWVKENLMSRFVAESKEIVTESFKQGMSYDEFVSNNGGFGYVCTHSYFLDGILKHGFSREYANANDFAQNGGSLTYGDGVYGTPDIKNAANNLSQKTASTYEKPDGFKYGPIILKCSILGGYRGFLIFDENWAKRIYGKNWQIFDQIDAIVKDDNARNEIKNFTRQYMSRELYNPSNDPMGRTNHVIYNMFNNESGFKKWTNFFRKYGVRGAVYNGHGDGFCFVCYDYSEVVPVEISYDHGKTWTTNGNSFTLPNGKTYSTKGINWQLTHDRLLYAGDPANKLGGMYKTVSSFPKKVCVDDTVFGCVSVEKNNGKWNCVRMDTLEELFPIDFDTEPTFSIRGIINFTYKGYKFEGTLYNRSVDGATFFYPNREGNEFNISDIDAVIYYYIEGHGEEDQQQNGNEYQEMPDEENRENIQESFFRFLDKMELL